MLFVFDRNKRIVRRPVSLPILKFNFEHLKFNRPFNDDNFIIISKPDNLAFLNKRIEFFLISILLVFNPFFQKAGT